MKSLAREIVEIVNETSPRYLLLAIEAHLNKRLREPMVAADSELSAIAHGRPKSPKAELEPIYHALRAIYEGKG